MSFRDKETRRCSTCRQDLPHLSFHLRRKGSDLLQSTCKKCSDARRVQDARKNPERAYATQRRALNKKRLVLRDFVALFLSENPCVDCGEADPEVLEFDHVRGVKRYAISTMVTTGFSLKQIEDEMAKCEIRCANCHRRKTGRERGWWNRSLSQSKMKVERRF